MSLRFHWFLPANGDSRDIARSAGQLGAGVGLVRGGAGPSLAGSREEVANLIGEYASLGITEFIMSGYPHLEEAYWFGAGVLPILAERGPWRHPYPRPETPPTLSPFAPTTPTISTNQERVAAS